MGSYVLFTNRKEGLIGLTETHARLYFKSVKPMDQSLTYQALLDGYTDIMHHIRRMH